MDYAPVIIPTLNRKEHLERCITSLANNLYAKDTDIYISVDYPPNEKYINGYTEVKDYLKMIKDKNWFRSTNVYFQEENLGPKENTEFLKNIVKEHSKTYIFSEDDNEFSRNFLEYINKGLDRFENDPNVLAICGCKDADWISKDDILLGKIFCAYGYGSWFAKDTIYFQHIENVLLSKECYKFRTLMNLRKKNKFLFNEYILSLLLADTGLFWGNDKKLRICDTTRSMYMHFYDKYCILPMTSKTRNWGNDGTGANMPEVIDLDPMTTWLLDQNDHFEYQRGSIQFDEDNYKVGSQHLGKYIIPKRNVMAFIEYFIFALVGFRRDKAIPIIKKIKGK